MAAPDVYSNVCIASHTASSNAAKCCWTHISLWHENPCAQLADQQQRSIAVLSPRHGDGGTCRASCSANFLAAASTARAGCGAEAMAASITSLSMQVVLWSLAHITMTDLHAARWTAVRAGRAQTVKIHIHILPT